LGTLLFAKSRVQKNRVIVNQKEKRPGFLNNIDVGFLHPVFFKKQGA
jgi:hypothetical protein